jgi:Amt family ammonium transporter
MLADVLPFDDTQVILDNIWVLIAAVLVMFMQAGFAMLEAGLTEARSSSMIVLMNLFDFAIGVVVFGVIGFHIAFSGASLLGFDWQWSQVGALPTTEDTLTIETDFLFQVAFAATAATIVSGALAGRCQFRGYAVYSVIMTMLIYPVVVGWTWGGGWLSQLTTPFEDFAGSTVVHSVGGWAALVGAVILGPRMGKFAPDGTPRAIPPHAMPLAILGVLILVIGWFGFNPGSELAADLEVPRIAMNTAIAGATGALAATAAAWWKFGQPDVSMTGNGVLAGLVAITAGCFLMDPWMAGLTGLIAGTLVVGAALFIERRGVDDPVGAVSVHLCCGIWGTLAVGLFASKDAPLLREGEAGLLTGGSFDLLISQAIGVVAVAAFVIPASALLFLALRKAGWFRVPEAAERAGLDVAELGVAAYNV